MSRPVPIPVHVQFGSEGWQCFERQLVIWRGSYIFRHEVSSVWFLVSRNQKLETRNSNSLPPHPLPQFRDVGHVMLTVPGIKCQVLFQRHDARLWVAEASFPILRLKRAQ